MFDLSDFDLPGAVAEQLEKTLAKMASSVLDANALEKLADFQQQHRIQQGVYQIIFENRVVYVGKAVDARDRLDQHLRKLRGRLNMDLSRIHFRCLLLHGNWSTSANEGLLIAHYKTRGEANWNSSGFGAKDVGKERDGTEPNWFDRQFPINSDFRCDGIKDRMTVQELFQSLKEQLPFTFRFKLTPDQGARVVDLAEVKRSAAALIGRALVVLGPEWQVTQFPSHIIVYCEYRVYPHGKVLPAG